MVVREISNSRCTFRIPKFPKPKVFPKVYLIPTIRIFPPRPRFPYFPIRILKPFIQIAHEFFRRLIFIRTYLFAFSDTIISTVQFRPGLFIKNLIFRQIFFSTN